jgi:hypothetical protein
MKYKHLPHKKREGWIELSWLWMGLTVICKIAVRPSSISKQAKGIHYLKAYFWTSSIVFAL